MYHPSEARLGEDETICFMDGVHPTHNVQNQHTVGCKLVSRKLDPVTKKPYFSFQLIESIRNAEGS